MTPKNTPARLARAMRANGGPFAILYEPRRVLATTCTAPKKTGPKPKNYNFCTSIATQADSDKTARIKGKSL
jgi:hypothetical protein